MLSNCRLRQAYGILIALSLGLAPVALRADSTDLGWGPTHVEWESQAIRSSIGFGEMTATTTRRPNGAIVGVMRDQKGAALARFSLSADLDTLRLKVHSKRSVRQSVKLSYSGLAAPPLAWVNLQLLSWLEDHESLMVSGENASGREPGHTKRALRSRSLDQIRWEDGFVRAQSAEARERGVSALMDRVTASVLVYPDAVASSVRTGAGFTTTLWKKTREALETTASEKAPGEPMALLVWEQEAQRLFFATGEQVRANEWFEIRAEDLPLGFFPFQPSMPWADVQLWQLWLRGDSRSAGGDQILLKDTPGCDYLHFLDNSSLRRCCDVHDYCYKAPKELTGAACSATSWYWPFCGEQPGCTWSCQQCNIGAFLCFGVNLRLHGGPDINGGGWGITWSWGGPPPWCYVDIPGSCPTWCAGCNFP